LEFREPKELCLGYTAEGTSGSGSGGKLGKLIAQAISEAIGRGLTNPNHFEELGILQERIGADRISDTTCTILKLKFVEYTQRIARAHGIPLAPHRLYAGAFDAQRQRFESPTVHAPTNPATGGPLLFVPERFLRDLPQLNKDDWWAYYENQRLRDDLNYEVMGRVDKRTIVATARAHMDSVRRWADEKETQPAQPYDLERDPKGVVQWEAAAGAFTDANPLTIVAPVDSVGFDAVIETVVEQFRLFVEEQRGWSLLWDGAKDKPEAAPQLVFYGIARNYCKANNVVIDPETDLGRGPVDFKFSGGYVHRAHLEVKKLHNGKFWNGLDLQLPAYMSSDRCRRVGSWRSDTETASNGTSAPTSCLVASGPPLRTTTETFGMRLSTRDVGRRHPSCESHPPGVSPRPPTRASPLRLTGTWRRRHITVATRIRVVTPRAVRSNYAAARRDLAAPLFRRRTLLLGRTGLGAGSPLSRWRPRSSDRPSGRTTVRSGIRGLRETHQRHPAVSHNCGSADRLASAS